MTAAVVGGWVSRWAPIRLNLGMPLTVAPQQALPPHFSATEFREALGMFATGVTVVTARDAHGKFVGLTAGLAHQRKVWGRAVRL